MSFFRHAEIYRGEVALIREGAAPKKYRSLPHPLDESPVGYSSASCSPAGLASASPTGGDFERKGFCRTINSQQTVNSVLTTCLSPRAHPNAEMALSQEVRDTISDEAKRDFTQSGRCLAFELATAS